MDAHGGYKKLLGHIDGLQREIFSQMKNRKIDQIRLRQNFPLGHIYLSSGKNNFISRFIEYCGYQFKTIEMDLSASPVMGLNGFFLLFSILAE